MSRADTSVRDSPWHLITGEFPPMPGGVGDYTLRLSEALAAGGTEVHVWCPAEGAGTYAPGVTVHADLGILSVADLRRVGRLLDEYPGPRRLLVQWVPHAFGYRSMNLAFCLWVLGRARRSLDTVDLMVHEPFLPFAGPARLRAAAAVHRLMTVALLRAATRIWVSVPSWERRLAPYLLGRRVAMRWLPIPSNVAQVDDAAAVSRVRDALTQAPVLLGHFGTYGNVVADPLGRVALDVLHGDGSTELLLLGRGGREFREALVSEAPELSGRLHATGALDTAELSIHIQACDLMVQPFPDGISTRRTTAMACLAHGRPVASTLGENSEPFWSDEECVALVPADEPGALSTVVLALVEDADRRARMGDAARRLYDERFDLPSVVGALCGAT